MAQYLVDTNLLLRLSDTPSPQNRAAGLAIAFLFREGNDLFITAQNLIEFWAVATRPREINGLGWTVERARAELKAIRERFPLIPDTPAVFEEWINLVTSLGITGKRVHDARLVAVMNVSGIDHLLTFNAADFENIPGIWIVEPRTVVMDLPES